jgi:hypothetical protein
MVSDCKLFNIINQALRKYKTYKFLYTILTTNKSTLRIKVNSELLLIVNQDVSIGSMHSNTGLDISL